MGHSARHRAGGTLIETVISMSLLLMLTFGAVEFSYFFYVKNIMAGAARNGARAAIPPTATNADVTAAVLAAMTAAKLPATAYTLTTVPADVSASSVVPGTPIAVTITANWGTIGITPLATTMGGISSGRTVTATVVMQREQ